MDSETLEKEELVRARVYIEESAEEDLPDSVPALVGKKIEQILTNMIGGQLFVRVVELLDILKVHVPLSPHQVPLKKLVKCNPLYLVSKAW